LNTINPGTKAIDIDIDAWTSRED